MLFFFYIYRSEGFPCTGYFVPTRMLLRLAVLDFFLSAPPSPSPSPSPPPVRACAARTILRRRHPPRPRLRRCSRRRRRWRIDERVELLCAERHAHRRHRRGRRSSARPPQLRRRDGVNAPSRAHMPAMHNRNGQCSLRQGSAAPHEAGVGRFTRKTSGYF